MFFVIVIINTFAATKSEKYSPIKAIWILIILINFDIILTEKLRYKLKSVDIKSAFEF